jgi:hypothetical protein
VGQAETVKQGFQPWAKLGVESVSAKGKKERAGEELLMRRAKELAMHERYGGAEGRSERWGARLRGRKAGRIKA